jgi:hypothetical protein
VPWSYSCNRCLADASQPRLAHLADNYAMGPEQIAVGERQPYTFLGIASPPGNFAELMAVEDRAAACFWLSRQAPAQRYHHQLVAAIRSYRAEQTPAPGCGAPASPCWPCPCGAATPGAGRWARGSCRSPASTGNGGSPQNGW